MELNVKSANKDYNIYIENFLLDHIEDYIDINKHYIIVSDSNVMKLYANKITKKLTNFYTVEFPEGEASKSFLQYETIVRRVLEKGIRKDSVIIALGGGVTGDLAGFVAATILRGVDFIQIPTTLLSQIDSSIGGKVGINTDSTKNSVGSIYPPTMVLIDPQVLNTLPLRQFNNGVAEMIKYGMIKSKTLFNDLKNLDIRSNIDYYIHQSLMIKKDLVEKDEFDKFERHLLNFGHTFGHAYEAYYNYSKYLHGEAVALGMLLMIDESLKDELKSVLIKYDLPYQDSASKEELLNYIKLDKKATSNGINIVRVDKIGEAYIAKKQIEEL